MRILHILNHTVPANGHVSAMVDLACTQARLGHQVFVCSAGGGFDALLSQYGIEHIIVDQSRKPAILLAALFKTHRALRRIRPDIVHAHMMTSAIIAALLRPLLGFKLVTTVHNDFQRSAILMGLGQRVIGVSAAVSQAMIKRGISPKKMRTVLNGTIGSPRFPPPLPAPLALHRPAILFVGGLHPRKGVDDLINAFGIIAKQSKQAHLYLIGSGPFQPEYERLAAAQGNGRITFCGHLADPRPYLLGGDVFVRKQGKPAAPSSPPVSAASRKCWTAAGPAFWCPQSGQTCWRKPCCPCCKIRNFWRKPGRIRRSISQTCPWTVSPNRPGRSIKSC
jgi:glycosyltransferase involved in cell wall biosynthesis